jgi:hypothetical protein
LLLLDVAAWLEELSGEVLEVLLCGVVAAALWSEVVALGLVGCEYDGDAAELLEALLLGAAAAEVVSVLLGAVADCA